MNPFPEFNADGDLPPAIYRATLDEVSECFGKGTLRRQQLARRLERIYRLAIATNHLARFIVFGSFVTEKPNPGDVDIFILMDDDFNAAQLEGETALLFDHLATQNYEGASIFWIRRLAILDSEEETVAHWQLKRDGSRRGIVEVIQDAQE